MLRQNRGIIDFTDWPHYNSDCCLFTLLITAPICGYLDYRSSLNWGCPATRKATMSNEHWMRDLAPELRDMSIINLAIPGMHEVISPMELINATHI